MKEYFGKENFEDLCDWLKEVLPTKGPLGFEKVVMSDYIEKLVVNPNELACSLNVTPGNWLFFTKGYVWDNGFIECVLYDEKYGYNDFSIPSVCVSTTPTLFLKIEENTNICVSNIVNKVAPFYNFQLVGIKFSDVSNESSSGSENKGIGFINYREFFYPSNVIMAADSKSERFVADRDCWCFGEMGKKNGGRNDAALTVDNVPAYFYFDKDSTVDVETNETEITFMIPLKKGQTLIWKRDCVFFRGCFEMMY